MSTKPSTEREHCEAVAVEAFRVDPEGATYQRVAHHTGKYWERGDYALVELRDGSVVAWYYRDDLGWTGPVLTPCAEGTP